MIEDTTLGGLFVREFNLCHPADGTECLLKRLPCSRTAGPVYQQSCHILHQHINNLFLSDYGNCRFCVPRSFTFSMYARCANCVKVPAQFSINHENPPILIKSQDEYGELAKTLNVIGAELSKFDEYQRKFISNISHDFRSPLTSIQGLCSGNERWRDSGG